MKLKNINPRKTAVSLECARALVPYNSIVDIDDVHFQTAEVQNAISHKVLELIGKVEIHPEEEEYDDNETVRYSVHLPSGHMALQYLEGDKRATYRVSKEDKFLTVPKKHSFAPDFLGAEKAKFLIKVDKEEFKTVEPELSAEELEILEKRSAKPAKKKTAQKTATKKTAKKRGRPSKKAEKKEEVPFEIKDSSEEKPKKIKSSNTKGEEVTVMDLAPKKPETNEAIKAFDDFLVVEEDGPKDMLLEI